MSEAPPFWFEKPGILAWTLSPLGAAYGRVTARRMTVGSKFTPAVPVFCIGNFIVGGAGKTPTAIAVAAVAKSLGIKPGFLSRGYGGSLQTATLVAPETHNSRDVGDEPLMLCKHGPTVVCPDRIAGSKLLEQQGIDLILMDDGFQNPSLHKDYSLAVVDTRRGLGNGYCMPAGPVRAELRTQLAAASALLLIGKSGSSAQIVRRAAKMAKPIINADIKILNPRIWPELKVLAYAGIADPKKFYLSLEQAGADVVANGNFHDHHPFSDEDCADLLGRAKTEGLTLVTTEKDAARLAGMGTRQEELLNASQVLKIELEFENPKMIEMALRDAVRLAREHRLKMRDKEAV